MSRRGQALTEFLLAGIFCLAALSFAFFCGLKILYTMATDESLEVYCICRLAAGEDCETTLLESLKRLGFKNVRLTQQKDRVAVEALAAGGLILARSREFKPL